jgi:hypothetical protein
MPTYSLTSPTTGQSYDVDFSGAPSEADMEQAVAFYDQKFDELGGQHPRLLNQSTAGTAGMAAFRSLGDAAMNAIGGLAKLADVGGAQSFQAITGLPISTGLQDLAKQTDQIKEEARRVFGHNDVSRNIPPHTVLRQFYDTDVPIETIVHAEEYRHYFEAGGDQA